MKYFFTLLTVIILYSSSFAQKHYEDVRTFPKSMDSRLETSFLPKEYRAVQFDLEAMMSYLSNAPVAYSGGRNELTVDLPLPNGKSETFYIWEAPVMQAEISARYPHIKTYKGYNQEQNMITRFDFTPSGFHASIRTLDGEIYIDPYSKEDRSFAYSYYTRDHQEPQDGMMTCGTDHSRAKGNEENDQQLAFNREGEIDLHEFKIALACTGEWGRNRNSVDEALGDMVTSVNRLNQIYENEFASRFILINDNDKLIHRDPATDPYPNATEGRALLGINTSVVNNILNGSGSYDLGHVYTNRCSDVGGVAFLASLCNNNNKAGGVTCHYTNLEYITVQVAAHEIGHQLSAQHTFNNCPDGDGDNGNASLGNDFEPGSGSTIMSYGGLCGQNNIQGRNDDFYHHGSLRQIYNRSRLQTGGAYGCSDKVPTSNIPPVVNIPYEDGFYIPINSFFSLTGEASDENDDNLTFSWEQADPGNTGYTLGSPSGSAPLFRVYPPTESPTRFFPAPNRILNNTSNNTEILPFYERDISFMFVARDNNPEGGIATWDKLEFKVDATAGPFQVMSPNLGESYKSGDEVMVTWNVANTDNAKVNCQEVDIYLMTSNSMFVEDMILLSCNTPNDGEEAVIMPNITSGVARVMVKAANNIFFDISNFRFSIEEAEEVKPYFDMDVCKETFCLPSSSQVTINSAGLNGYSEMIAVSVEDVPEGIEVVIADENIMPGESTTIDFNASNQTKSGVYDIRIIAEGTAGERIARTFTIDVTSTNFDDLASIYPENGTQEIELIPDFLWSKSFNADLYEIEISRSPTFDEDEMEDSAIVSDTTYNIGRTLPLGEVFYWRVKAMNDCGEGEFSEIRAFGTRVLSCVEFSSDDLPKNISQSGRPVVESIVPITTSGEITDLNILDLGLQHSFLKDLNAKIVSPDGTEVVLFEDECPRAVTLNASFDDDGARPFSCSVNVPQQFRPKGTLADFNGKDTEGLWKVIIEDSNSGQGGEFESFTMEICGSVAVQAPTIVTNEVIQIQPNNKPYIRTNVLKAEDPDNDADDLIFTLVKDVSSGILQLQGAGITVGDKFSQRDIDFGRLQYIHNGIASEDSFDFLVEDGEGGWAGIETFKIEIDASFPSSTNEAEFVSGVAISPNPASQLINIELSDSARTLTNVTVTDVAGKIIFTRNLKSTNEMVNISALQNGIYLIKLADEKNAVVKRIVVQK